MPTLRINTINMSQENINTIVQGIKDAKKCKDHFTSIVFYVNGYGDLQRFHNLAKNPNAISLAHFKRTCYVKEMDALSESISVSYREHNTDETLYYNDLGILELDYIEYFEKEEKNFEQEEKKDSFFSFFQRCGFGLDPDPDPDSLDDFTPNSSVLFTVSESDNDEKSRSFHDGRNVTKITSLEKLKLRVTRLEAENKILCNKDGIVSSKLKQNSSDIISFNNENKKKRCDANFRLVDQEFVNGLNDADLKRAVSSPDEYDKVTRSKEKNPNYLVLSSRDFNEDRDLHFSTMAMNGIRAYLSSVKGYEKLRAQKYMDFFNGYSNNLLLQKIVVYAMLSSSYGINLQKSVCENLYYSFENLKKTKQSLLDEIKPMITLDSGANEDDKMKNIDELVSTILDYADDSFIRVGHCQYLNTENLGRKTRRFCAIQ